MDPLRDSWGREIKSVRVSVTDKCNFRCTYCMPAEGLQWLGRQEILSFEEISRLVGVLARLGVDEVRLTGGEPLVRRDLPVLVGMLAQTEGVRDLSLTTNGVLLDRLAGPLVEAGLQRLNVSLDSLNHVRFAEITRRDALDAVLRGLDEAERYPELRPIKINCVAVKGFTETEVPALAELARRKPYVVRFIEFMPLDADEAWREDDVLTGAEIRRIIENEHGPLVELPAKASSTARRFRFADGAGELGAVLLQLRPHPHHCRRAAPYVPFLTKGMGPEDALARGRRRPGTRRAPPFRRAAQGAETQDQRPWLRASLAFNVANRRMRPHAGDF
jgi:cyclic pyranopterin phosphate synthase